MGKHEEQQGTEGETSLGGAAPLYQEGEGRRTWKELVYPLGIGALPVVVVLALVAPYLSSTFLGVEKATALLGWDAPWDAAALAIELGAVSGLVLLGLWLGYQLTFRVFASIDRRRDGFYRARRVRVAGNALARHGHRLDEAAGAHAPVDAAFAGGGMFESPADDAGLAFFGTVMAVLAVVETAALSSGMGLRGIRLGHGFLIPPLVAYLAGPRHGRWAPTFTLLGLAGGWGLCTFVLAGEASPSEVLGLTDLVFAGLFAAALRRRQRDWHAHATPRFLARAGGRWFVIDCQPGDESAHEVEPDARPTLQEDVDGFVLEVPVGSGGTLPVRLAHIDEVERLRAEAPARWELPSSPPRARPHWVRRGLQLLAVAGGSLLFGWVTFVGCLYGLDTIVHLADWNAGNPHLLHDAAQRALRLVPGSEVGHGFAAQTSLDLGRFADARRHAEAALEVTGGYGQVGRMARFFLHGTSRPTLEPEVVRAQEEGWKRLLEIESETHSLQEAPDGWTLEAWRRYRFAARLHELFQERIRTPLIRPFLPVLVNLRAAREASERPHREVLELLVGILRGDPWQEGYGGRSGLPDPKTLGLSREDLLRMELELADFLPEADRALARGDAYFRARSYDAALPFLEEDDSPESRLRSAFVLLLRSCRDAEAGAPLREALDRVRTVTGTPEGRAAHARALEAWLLAERGDLESARTLLGDLAEEPDAAWLAVDLEIFLRATLGDLRAPRPPWARDVRARYFKVWDEVLRSLPPERERSPRPSWLPEWAYDQIEDAQSVRRWRRTERYFDKPWCESLDEVAY